jgi:Arc-like DNA binding domain
MARKTTEIVSLSLRIREELRKRLEREAKRADRSMNAEIVHRLEQSFQQEDIIKTIKEVIGDLKKAALRDAGADPDKSEGEDKS